MARLTRIALVAGVAAIAASTLYAQAQPDYQQAVNAAYKQFQTLKEGKNADYIPALAKVDPNLFGIALITVDGKVFTAGDIKTEVSIQSISKVFTMLTRPMPPARGDLKPRPSSAMRSSR